MASTETGAEPLPCLVATNQPNNQPLRAVPPPYMYMTETVFLRATSWDSRYGSNRGSHLEPERTVVLSWLIHSGPQSLH